MLTIEKVLILKSVSIFKKVSTEVLAEVASGLKEMTVEADEKIVTKGDMGRSMYIIVEGAVRVHDEVKDVVVLGDREIFGELAALNPEPRTFSVTASEKTTLFRLDFETLQSLIEEQPELAQGIIHVLCKRLQAPVAETDTTGR